MTTTREKLATNRTRLGFFRERGDELEALDLAVLTRQHVLLVGPPGTAKSLLARTFCAQFSDAVYWEGLLTRQTVEDQILGHLDVPAFVAGRQEYRFDGYLPPAHLAFIDECFKATGGLLNSLLGVLNERQLCRGPVRYSCPLVSAIGASNEWGEDDATAALEDRFVLRCAVGYVEDRAERTAYLRDRANRVTPPALEPVTLAELEQAQREVAATPVDPTVDPVLCDLAEQLARVGVVLSDRRLGQCQEILQAAAWLAGDSEAGVEHLDALRHVLWSRPEQIPAVLAALANVDKGIVGEIRALVEPILDRYHNLRAACGADGSWSSESSRRAYLGACPAMAQELRTAAATLKARRPSLPARVAARVAGYRDEMKVAYAQIQEDAKL